MILDRKQFGILLALLVAVFLAASALLAATAWAAPVLKVTTTDAPDPVKSGEELTYTITIDNTGDMEASNVELENELDPSVEFVSAESSDGTECTESNNVVTCDLTPIGSDEPPTKVTIKVTAGNAGTIENEATVTAQGIAADTDTENTTVVPNLEITKLDNPDPAILENPLVYTLRIENRGGGTANNVEVRDELPLDQVDFQSVEGTAFDTCSQNAGIVRCTGASIDVGEVVTVEIVVEPEKEGTIENRAQVLLGGKVLDEATVSTTVEGDNDGGGSGGGTGGGGTGGGGTGGGGTGGGTGGTGGGTGSGTNDGTGSGNDPGFDEESQDEEKGPLAGATLIGEDVLVPGDLLFDENGDPIIDSITGEQVTGLDQFSIETENCVFEEEGDGLTLTRDDSQGNSARLRDGENVDFTLEEDGTILIQGRDEVNGEPNPDRVIFSIPVTPEDVPDEVIADGNYTINSTTGIGGEGCQAVDSANTEGEDDGDDSTDDGTDDDGTDDTTDDSSDDTTDDDTTDDDTTDDDTSTTDDTTTDDGVTDDDTGLDLVDPVEDTGTDVDNQTPVDQPQGDVIDEIPTTGPLPETGGSRLDGSLPGTGGLPVAALVGFLGVALVVAGLAVRRLGLPRR